MTAVALPVGADPLFALLASVDQIDEWAARLPDYRIGDRRLVVTHTRDRRSEAAFLADGLGVGAVSISRLDRLEPHLARGDLIVVLASATARVHSAACPAAGPLATLHRLLRAGVEIWGITGPRPNSVADHCHDAIAVPHGDPGIGLKSHQLIAQLLVRRTEDAPVARTTA
ncbi:MAG TPA: hypothetical protein VHL52_08365 [Acidimicrobiia bacterium]|nr:hypothetical protein [Acidimicrobiia bacterium]